MVFPLICTTSDHENLVKRVFGYDVHHGHQVIVLANNVSAGSRLRILTKAEVNEG